MSSTYDPDMPSSDWCYGYRTGIIKGKRKALKNAPDDVLVHCILIGSHSEACGKYCFVYNIPDLYLQLRNLLLATYRLGLLKRTVKRTLITSKGEIMEEIERVISELKQQQAEPVVDRDDRCVEFFCSCEEDFFREYNHNHGDKYYRPTKEDLVFMKIHRDLGHTVYYRKMRRVKHSKEKNSSWQTWGPYKYRVF